MEKLYCHTGSIRQGNKMGNPVEGNQYKHENKANPQVRHTSKSTYAIHQERKIAWFPFSSSDTDSSV